MEASARPHPRPQSLSDSWQSLRRRTLQPWLGRFRKWRTVSYGRIRVHYKKHLDGGGSSFGQEFIPFLRGLSMPKQGRAFEWCAGPGFIGFSMLAHGLCETLCVADINPEAVEACRRTIADNNLQARVACYRSDNLNDIPVSERWDLVVSNPPHFADEYIGELRTHDPDWRIHRGFFAGIAAHLNPGGVVVLQENNNGSTADTFRAMIEAAGLAIVFVHGGSAVRTPDHRFYYIGIMRAGDAPPAWAARV